MAETISPELADAFRTRAELLGNANLTPEEEARLDAANAVVAALPPGSMDTSTDYLLYEANRLIREAVLVRICKNCTHSTPLEEAGWTKHGNVMECAVNGFPEPDGTILNRDWVMPHYSCDKFVLEGGE